MDPLTRLLLDALQGGERARRRFVSATQPDVSRRHRYVRRTITSVGVLAGVTLLTACGSSTTEPDLPPAAAEGRSLVRSKGCAACHGSSGDGGVGPAFVGLYGSEVPLQSGETVTADRDYLVESIVDPSAQLVEGYNLPMPRTDLSDDEIDAIIAYIEALTDVTP